jgi:deoxyribodipyrimidine photolyase-related protein
VTHAALIYPHQLFVDHPALVGVSDVVLVEEPLLFSQWTFHRQKLMLHRASMMRFAEDCRQRKLKVHYVEAATLDDTAAIAPVLKRLRIRSVQYVDPCDDWLSTRLTDGLRQHGIIAKVIADPHFLTPLPVIQAFVEGKKRLYFTDFYVAQRQRLGILLEPDHKPTGGQWSFDPDNRKKLPNGISVPTGCRVEENDDVREARQRTRERFPSAIGFDGDFSYPTDHAGAAAWLDDFVRERLASFGDYEDAISSTQEVLFHSVLTPMLNIGLLSPQQVVDAALAERDRIPLNSLEGFLRQVIGWREFVRLVYLTHGRRQRTRNFWEFTREIPSGFYNGSTGIDPVDHVIRQVLRTGYCHHIERLMILGNFLLLCDVHPDAVYRWFMALFIDAYDWVMVPNVYGMSQYADEGMMTTKPYISGSNYVLKMSDFKRGPWCEVWDGLYWRFIDRHADFFACNPRMAMMVRMKDKLGAKLAKHLDLAEDFLSQLHS